ncbi:MAG: DinB family protein [Vicinamibacterales bacterium]
MLLVPSLDHLTIPIPAPPPPRLLREGRRLPVRRLDRPRPPALPERLADLLRALDTARGRTARLAAGIPDSAFDWAPTPGAFTCADLLRHLAAAERHLFVEVALGGVSRYPGHDKSLAYGREGVLAYLDAMHEESMALLQRLDDEALERRVAPPTGAQIPTWRWLQLMTEHEAHHRGQLDLMLRLLGVETPRLFGIADGQLRAQSHQ